jgi:hypothetical protein
VISFSSKDHGDSKSSPKTFKAVKKTLKKIIFSSKAQTTPPQRIYQNVIKGSDSNILKADDNDIDIHVQPYQPSVDPQPHAYDHTFLQQPVLSNQAPSVGGVHGSKTTLRHPGFLS